ncbi:MAG: oligosaccharide flippase family protein [Candidatus Hodarchaeota archaeon]
MDQSKRLIINSICSVFSLLVQLSIGIFLVPYILHHLTKEVYGIWALTGSLLGYFTLLTLGLNSAVNRYVPMHLVNNDWDSMNRVINTTLFFYVVCGMIILVATVFIIFNFVSWFAIPETYRVASIMVVAISGIGLAWIVPLTVFSAVLSGLQRYELQSVSNISSRFTRVIAIIAIFRAGLGFVALSIVTVAANLFNHCITAYFAIKKCKKLKFNWRFVSWSTFRDMFAYSVNSFIYATGGLIQLQAGKLMIGWMMGAGLVTEYEMPSFLLLQLTALVMAGAKVMKPAASSLDAQKKYKHIQIMYLLGVKYAFMIVIPNTILFILFGKAIMNIWLNEASFVGTSAQVLMILAIPEMFRLGHVSAYFVVVGLGKHKVFGITTFVTGITSIILAYLIEIFLHLGVISIAIGFAIPNLVTSAFIIPLYCCRTVGLKLKDVFYQTYTPAIFSCIPFCTYLVFMRIVYCPTVIVQLLILLGVGLLILLFSWWIIGFKAEEKIRFLGYLLIRKEKIHSRAIL